MLIKHLHLINFNLIIQINKLIKRVVINHIGYMSCNLFESGSLNLSCQCFANRTIVDKSGGHNSLSQYFDQLIWFII